MTIVVILYQLLEKISIMEKIVLAVLTVVAVFICVALIFATMWLLTAILYGYAFKKMYTYAERRASGSILLGGPGYEFTRNIHAKIYLYGNPHEDLKLLTPKYQRNL
uniref:Uncharacterized protein n=1 Tax=Glossina austeni TaxID=7395 RepID=A0A1A9UIN6_GLOAU